MAETRNATVLTVGHGNGRNERSLVEYVTEAECDSFSAQEAQTLIPEFRSNRLWRIAVAGKGWTEKDDRAKSTVIITRNDLPNIGEFAVRVSKRIPCLSVAAPDIVLVCSMYEHPVAEAQSCKGIAHFSLQPVGGELSLRGESDWPIVEAYRESLEATGAYMSAARREGLIVVLTGDLQMPIEVAKPWSPVRLIANPLELALATTGHVDWIMWDRRLHMSGSMVKQRLYNDDPWKTGFPDHHIGFVSRFKAAESSGQ